MDWRLTEEQLMISFNFVVEKSPTFRWGMNHPTPYPSPPPSSRCRIPVFIGLLVIYLGMPDWSAIHQSLGGRAASPYMMPPPAWARNSPEQGAGAGRSSVRTW